MYRHLNTLRWPVCLARLSLAALLFQAYIPTGYMPAVGGGAFRLELCPVASGALPLAAHYHLGASAEHRHSDRHYQSCPFGCAPAAGPLLHLAAFLPPVPVSSAPTLPAVSYATAGPLPLAHRPRGPPILLG